jgi:hypothetical protein
MNKLSVGVSLFVGIVGLFLQIIVAKDPGMLKNIFF